MQKFIISEDDENGVETGRQIEITGPDARHISRVLRLGAGGLLSMTDGHGRDYTGEILRVAPDRVEVRVDRVETSQMESGLELTLCTAMLKHKKMDDIIKQATQLGVTRWIPFYSKRSVPRTNPKKEARQLERWDTIARESLKQCRRSRLVEIVPPTDFADMLNRVSGHDSKIAFWEAGGMPLSQAPGGASAALLIGPEGGFGADEIDQAGEKGFAAYSLGPRILRAETAAICAAGVVQYLLGDMGGAGAA